MGGPDDPRAAGDRAVSVRPDDGQGVMAGEAREPEKPKKRGLLSRLASHLVFLGFTNRLAVYLVLLLASGLAGGFCLAVMSIRHSYIGALACYTAVFAPIGTALSVVLSRIVDKSKAENQGADGEGIKFAAAKATGFRQDAGGDYSIDSPPI